MQPIFQKKSLILSVILFVLSCFIFVFFYKAIHANKEISQLAQEKKQTETAYRENNRSLFNSVKEIKPEIILLEKHFVKSYDVVPFLDTIEKLSREAGAKAEVVSVDTVKDSSSLIVEMKATGSFETLYKLIMLLENSPYYLEFVLVDIQNSNAQDISINSNKKTSEWTATFQLQLLSFIKE